MTALAETYRRITGATDAQLAIEELDDERFGMASAADGWIRGADLADDVADAFDALSRAAIGFTGEVDRKTVGLAMAWAAGPIVAGPLAVYAEAHRVPDLALSDLAFRPHGDRPAGLVLRPVSFECLASDPAAGVDPAARILDDAALRHRFIEVVEGLIDPVVERIHARTSVARSAIWGLAAGTVAYELAEAAVADAGVPAAIEVADRVLAEAPRLGRRRPELFAFDALGGAWFGLRSAVCCRADRWVGREGEKCLSCPLRDDESRLAGLRDWRASLLAPER